MDNTRVVHGLDFDSMVSYFDQAFPGSTAMMFDKQGSFRLTFSEFLNVVRPGLDEKSYLIVSEFYRQLTRVYDTEEMEIKYGREREPYAKIRGKEFPNAYAFIELGFLEKDIVVPYATVRSDPFIWYRHWNSDLGMFIEDESGIVVVDDHVYVPLAPLPGSTRPDGHQFVDENLRDAVGVVQNHFGDDEEYEVHTWTPPGPLLRQLEENFRTYFYEANLEANTKDLQTLIRMIETSTRIVQGSFLKAAEFIGQKGGPPDLTYIQEWTKENSPS